MSISPELFMAILSMDSYNRGYNRGYNPGISDLNSANIGNATAIDQTAVGIGEPEYQEWQSAGIYAVAYDWNGQTIISYRGTDGENLALAWELALTDFPIWSGDYEVLQLQRRASNWMRKGRCKTLKQCMYVVVQMNPFERDMHVL